MVGIIAVFALNAATPLDFMLDVRAGMAQKSHYELALFLAGRFIVFLLLVLAILGVVLACMRVLVRPISQYLSSVGQGLQPSSKQRQAARQRLLNLPFLSIPLNLACWIAIPAVSFIGAALTDAMEMHTGVVLTLRSFMVGLIATMVQYLWLEARARKILVPYFFPRGGLARIPGTARMSIYRRVLGFSRLSLMVPMIVLVATLLTVQWEVGQKQISAQELGRGLVWFVLVLVAVFYPITSALNRLTSNSIAEPLNDMIEVMKRVSKGDYNSRVKVVSNDEIGVLGDAGNAMIAGLADRHRLNQTFGKYVTPEIRDEILSGRIPLNGERREATMLFVDLRGFTPFVENNAPEEVMAGMRAYFTAMHKAIRRNRGVVLQFVGDQIEAVFGVPVPFENHAEAAVKAALAMRPELQRLNQLRAAQGKPLFAHGVGIHTGPVLAGISGSEEQSAYALIGDTVNVASRLQDLTKRLGCDILVSDQVARRLNGSYSLQEDRPHLLKGYSKPVLVHLLLE